ncbi:hypothetical protein D3C78_976630 [compost metagenome]
MKLDRQAGLFRLLDTGYKGTFFGVTGTSRQILAYGLRGNLYQSTDGGATWRKLETYMVSSLVADAAMRTGDVLLLSSDGRVLRSRGDGAGLTIVPGLQPVPVAASIIALDNDKSVVVGGVHGLSKRVLR